MIEISEVAGIEAAWALVQGQGGTTVFLPKAVAEGHWLAELVGLEAANKICRHFRTGNSGANVLIPMAKHAQQRKRLEQALRDGESAASAARTAGMHERTAFRARQKLKRKNGKGLRCNPDDKQRELF